MKLPKPFLINDEPATRTEIINLGLRLGCETTNLTLVSVYLRNKGYNIKHNPEHKKAKKLIDK